MTILSYTRALVLPLTRKEVVISSVPQLCTLTS